MKILHPQPMIPLILIVFLLFIPVASLLSTSPDLYIGNRLTMQIEQPLQVHQQVITDKHQLFQTSV